MIAIEWIYGRPASSENPEADESRAIAAAEAVLGQAGVSAFDAETEFYRQLEQFDDEWPMTGLARLWIEARNAADIALTEGWVNSGGASCSIHAR